MQLMHGDCLDLMAQIPDGSVDMIMCDLPLNQNRLDEQRRRCSRRQLKRIPFNQSHVGLCSVFKPRYESDIVEFKATPVGLRVNVIYGRIEPLILSAFNPLVVDGIKCRIEVKAVQKSLPNNIAMPKVLAMTGRYSGQEFKALVGLVFTKVNGCSEPTLHVLPAKRFRHLLSIRPRSSSFCRRAYFRAVFICEYPLSAFCCYFNIVANQNTLDTVVIRAEFDSDLPERQFFGHIKPDYLNFIHKESHLFNESDCDYGIYMGQVGAHRKFIGIEKDAGYFAIAQRRIEQAQQQLFAGVAA